MFIEHAGPDWFFSLKEQQKCGVIRNGIVEEAEEFTFRIQYAVLCPHWREDTLKLEKEPQEEMKLI